MMDDLTMDEGRWTMDDGRWTVSGSEYVGKLVDERW